MFADLSKVKLDEKTILLLLVVVCFCSSTSCSADGYRNLPLTNALLGSDITIVDIRSEREWRETGVVPGSVLLTFFSSDRSYDLVGFMDKLSRHVREDEEIALLCRSGNRSAKVAHLLAEGGYTSIINITGGIHSAAGGKGVELVPYPASL